MLLLIPLLPLLGFLANAFVGRRLSKSVSGGLACLAIIASFAVSALSVWTLLGTPSGALERVGFTWMSSGSLHVRFALRLDHLSSVMILVVTGIGSLIHLYSTGYMHEETDAEYARYFSYLNLFASFMLVLVLGANFPVMFVGWEGVGLCSYLLIGFWFRKQSAIDAGKKAFVVNRIGDVGFILGMLLIFATFGTFDFQAVAVKAAALAPEHGVMGMMTIATLLLFVGATGKSAQIPLFVWLPDAMEGPTPVSALIHAATMVTAGVYMIGRNAVLFSHAPTTLAVVAGVGAATALMAGTIGLVQNDIKRVLAYSTVSQLGYMFLAMGMGAYAAGIFHLYTHAFFKALLFLGSGAVIHALAGEQDLRNMGGLKKYLPITYWTFLIGALAIAGVPLLSGFFSKDEILYKTFVSHKPGYQLLWAIGLVTSLLTATYMFRLVFLAFHGERHAGTGHHPEETEPAGHVQHGSAHHGAALHDAPPSMAIPLIVLAIGSIVAGYIGVPHALGGSNRIERFLEPSFEVSENALRGPTTAVDAEPPGTLDARPLRVGVEREGGGAAVPASLQEPAHEAAEGGASTELMLMILSSAVAVAGIVIAMYFWLRPSTSSGRPEPVEGRNRDAADALSRRMHVFYNLLCNKYYVDEIYDAAIVQPVRLLSINGLWKAVDVGIVDGTVNGVGAVVRLTSGRLRRIQTGSVRTYAASLFLGVALILGWYLWR
jgi:NADH-quinone oxidoreductase subunit L